MSDNYLLDAIQRLTSTTTTRVEQINEYDDGRDPITCVSTVTHEPLLLQLRDAVAGGIGSHKGSTSARERIPFDAGALELFGSIAGKINGWYLELPGEKEHLHIHTRLTRWYLWFENERRAGRVTETVERARTKTLEGWVRSIENMFDPPTVFELTEIVGGTLVDGKIIGGRNVPIACPVCGNSKAFDKKTGDVMAALVVEYRAVGPSTFEQATGLCRFCEQVWRGGTGVRELRWMIDQAEGISA